MIKGKETSCFIPHNSMLEIEIRVDYSYLIIRLFERRKKMSKIVKFTIEQRSSDISENIWEREINSNQTKELIFEKLLIVFSPTGHYVGRVTSLSKYFAVVEISDNADYTLVEDFVIVPNFIFLKDACSTPILIGFNITPKKDDSTEKNSTKYVSEYYPDKNKYMTTWEEICNDLK